MTEGQAPAGQVDARPRVLALLSRTFPSVGGHLAALDGLRGIALLLVVFSHASLIGIHMVPGIDMSGTGKTGVWLFFVLSSFLLMHQFLQLDATGRLDAREWWRYAWRRVLRIYPLYIVFLLVCWLSPLDHYMPPMSAREVVDHLLVRRGFWLTWSIAVELKYYLVLPLLVLAYLHVARRRFLPATAMAAAAIVLHDRLAPPYHAYALWTYIVIFMVGSWVAVAHHHAARHPRLRHRLRHVSAGAACVLFVLLMAMTPSVWSLVVDAAVPLNHWHRSFTLFALLWGALLFCLLQAPASLQAMFAWWPLRVFGVVSFSGYLWHGLLLANLDWLPFAEGHYARALVLLAVLLLISAASYLVIERPFLAIGRARRRAENAVGDAPAAPAAP
jgi:peptidoglycan/LPS O-acetylase OafA/YrhL